MENTKINTASDLPEPNGGITDGTGHISLPFAPLIGNIILGKLKTGK